MGRLNVVLWFGLGFGLPLLLLSFLSEAAQRGIARGIPRQFALHTRKINTVDGLLLVGIGIHDLWSNWNLIRAFLG